MEPEKLKKLHEIELKILDEIVRICDKYNIVYYLLGGTLLGAIRHHGFIPWDDDLDIGMPRDDFNRFKKIAIGGELDKAFFYQDYETDKGHTMISAKIRMNNTLFIEKSIENVNTHKGIFVDIFPLDSGDGIVREKKIKLINHIYYHIQRVRRKKKKKIDYLLQIIPTSLWIFILKKKIMGHGDFYLNYGSQYGMIKQTMPKAVYDPCSIVVFEGKQYKAPNNPDFILKRLYGDDYMSLPPVEKRVTHNPICLKFETDKND